MAREYRNRRSSRGRSRSSSSFLVIIGIFLLGYLTAIVLDTATISRWVNEQVLAHQETKKTVSKHQTAAPQTAAVPPKPKFEFYTLLANEKAAESRAVAARQPATAHAPVTAVNTKTTVQRTAGTAAVATALPASVSKSNSPQTQQTVAMGVKPTTSPAVSKGYSVQVASFKARQDAEHMKGLLILKGFNVTIVPVNHTSKGNWFRVVVGPYANRILAQKAQIDLARNEHLRGMVTAG